MLYKILSSSNTFGFFKTTHQENRMCKQYKMSTRRKTSSDITKLLEQRVILRPSIIELRPKKSLVTPILKPIIRTLYPIKEISSSRKLNTKNVKSHTSSINKDKFPKGKKILALSHFLVRFFFLKN